MDDYLLILEYRDTDGNYETAGFPLLETDLGQLREHVQHLSARHLPTGCLLIGGRLDRTQGTDKNVH